MSDFSDRPFVAGSLTGIRSFKVDTLNQLTGVVKFNEIWRPGENIATCRAATGVKMFGYQYGPSSFIQGHTPGLMDCSCGYYAYFDTKNNPHHKEGQIMGLIEGYGVATVGDRGFRSEKAKILALIRPDGLSRLTKFVYVLLPAIVLLMNAITYILFLLKGDVGGALVVLLYSTFLVVADVKHLKGIKKSKELHKEIKVIADLYGVPVYPSLKEALKVHPLTVPSKSDPNDPDL